MGFKPGIESFNLSCLVQAFILRAVDPSCLEIQ